MTIEFERKTVNQTVSVSGRGLHSGVEVTVTIEPGEDGIAFCFGDRTKASPENVTDTSRCTRLGQVSTVEHLMSAFAGLGITDAEVLLDAPELPALDGSSLEYTKRLVSAGFASVGRATFTLFERVFYVDNDIRIGVSPGGSHWRFDFECGERWPHSQHYECALDLHVYESEIAAARTFAFEEEVAPLLAAGLAQGLDKDSALVLGREGYVNEPRWPDEPARHKMLDLIGDLYLSGVPPFLLNVVAVRSGHRSNVEAARRLAAHAVVARVG